VGGIAMGRSQMATRLSWQAEALRPLLPAQAAAPSDVSTTALLVFFSAPARLVHVASTSKCCVVGHVASSEILN
jgi:hypothetical protein